MSKRFELWKAHQESVSKFNYYIVALAATLFAYFLGNKGGTFSSLEMLSMLSLMISIIAGVLIIRENIKIGGFIYENATLNETYPNVDPTKYNDAVHKAQNWAIGFERTRNGSLFLSLLLIFLSRTI
jgi:hypothetical protein